MPVALPVQDFDEGEMIPDYSTSERLGAAWDLAEMDTFTATQGFDFWGSLDPEHAFGRDDILEKLAKGDKIGVMEPEELNKLFPYVEKPFEKPTSYLVADHLNKEGKQRRELMDVISNGGHASDLSTMGHSLIGGLAASATDPIEASADVVLSAITFGAAGIAAKGARAARLARKASAFKKLNTTRKILKGHRLGMAGRFGKESAEGIIANAALEPILLDSAQKAQVDYDAFDATVSVLGGGLGLPVLKHGTMGLGRYTLNNHGAMTKAMGTAFSHLKAGKRFDNVLNYVEENLINRIKGVDKSKLPADSPRAMHTIKHVPLEEIPRTKFYAAGLRSGRYNPESHHIMGEYYGDGLHVVDNPNIANNTAQLAENTHKGAVHQVNIEDANLLDLDTPTKSPEGAKIRERVPDELKQAFDDGDDLKTSLDNVKRYLSQDQDDIDDADLFNALNAEMKTLGYDGYKYFEGDSGNYAFLFSPDKAKLSESFKSDPTGIPKNSIDGQEKIRAEVASEKSDILYKESSAQDLLEVEKFQKEKQKLVDSQPENDAAYLEELMNDYNELKDTGVYDPEMAKELDALSVRREIDEMEAKGFKAYFKCLLMGGS